MDEGYFHCEEKETWGEVLAYVSASGLGGACLLAKGDYLYRQQEPAAFVYFILSGRLQILHLGSDGRQFIQRIFSGPSVIGLVPLLLQDRHMSSCQIIDDASLITLSPACFQQLIKARPDFNYLFMQGLASSVRYYSWTSRILSDSGVRERLLDCLKRVAYEYGIHLENGGMLLDIALTQENLAEMICCSRQNLSSQLNRLKDQGVLSMRNRKIIIEKPWF